MIAREKSSMDDSVRPNPSSPFPDGAKRGDAASGPSPFDPLMRHLAELQMLAGHYVRARADQVVASARKILLWAIAGFIGLIVAVAFLATAVVLLLHGIVTGLILLHMQPWAAELLTGIVCIAAVATTLGVVALSQTKEARRKRRDDYEHFRARYRAKFGHGVDEAGRNGK